MLYLDSKNANTFCNRDKLEEEFELNVVCHSMLMTYKALYGKNVNVQWHFGNGLDNHPTSFQMSCEGLRQGYAPVSVYFNVLITRPTVDNHHTNAPPPMDDTHASQIQGVDIGCDPLRLHRRPTCIDGDTTLGLRGTHNNHCQGPLGIGGLCDSTPSPPRRRGGSTHLRFRPRRPRREILLQRGRQEITSFPPLHRPLRHQQR